MWPSGASESGEPQPVAGDNPMSMKPHGSEARPAGHVGSTPCAAAFAPGGPAQVGHVDGGAGAVGFVPGSTAAAHAVLPLAAVERVGLDAAFRATLAHGVHGLCFSPYLEGQQPGSQIGERQIRERLAVVQPHARWVRSFSCTDGHEQTPRIAHEMGLKTLVGAWLGTDPEINARELAGVIAVAQAGHADIVAVGNEVLLREDLSEDELIAHLREVKAALPGVPVGYVDAYYLFETHPRVTAECDVVMTNCYPFWEGCPREQALPYMQTMLARTRAAAAGKRVLISETGWPDQGSAFHGAVPGTEAAMQYFVDTAAWAEAEGIEWFHFSAFDEAWKVGAEGDVGAFWGLWDKHARLKFA
jgi:glucan 1,3-beta-glucosidase